ncbi:sulfite exporter TauE/SafE family protein [Candidatus Roizmanbacteria bacterium]|nr:sulfite exporter TauE/SafE family protein [Candidatus Roizmanbacteria bacterium]
MAKLKKATLYINGMHCPSCDVLMNDKFREEANVIDVKPDFQHQKVEVFYTGHLDRTVLNNKIKQFGYEIVEGEVIKAEAEPFRKRFFEALGITAILVILYLIAQELGIVPSFNFSGNLSLLTIFVIGLVASTSTCMATSGALFLSTVGKSRDNFSQSLFFNAGRIVSYGFFGFLAGLVGQALITNLKFGPFLTLLAAVFMILLGLDMAKILSIGSIIPSGLNKSIFENLEHKLMKYPRKAPFFLGAITYFLPCGFTQAVQVYALGLASPFLSAATMMVFAIGTTPALLLVGGLSSLTKSGFYSYFMKTMGVIVFIIGFFYFSNFLSLYNININPLLTNAGKNGMSASLENGVQTINMRVVASGYVPNYFTVKKGIPVKWKIQGENVFGCQAYFIVPTLGVQKTIELGENLIEFTPTAAGPINFSCGMGMYRGRIEVID